MERRLCSWVNELQKNQKNIDGQEVVMNRDPKQATQSVQQVVLEWSNQQ
jgi:hypothetical protein